MTNIPQKIVFKVAYGYRASDFVLLENLDDVCRAIYAKVERLPVTLAGKLISGTEIKVIEPDVHSYTGWYRTHSASEPEDFAQIERDVPSVMYKLMDQCNQRVQQLLAKEQEMLIGREGLTPQQLLASSTTDANIQRTNRGGLPPQSSPRSHQEAG